jgi:hypothetical protein
MSGARNMYDEIDEFFADPGTILRPAVPAVVGVPAAAGVAGVPAVAAVPAVYDKRGRLFVSLNYKGNNYSQSVNTKENPNTIVNEPIYQLMLAKNYVTDLDKGDNVISTQFIDFVRALGVRHRALDGLLQQPPGTPLAAGNYKTADTLANIYGNWPNLTQDTRDFYMQLVNLISVDGTNQPTTDVPYRGNNMATFRLNLKKVNVNDPLTETLFGTTLPYLPSGSVDVAGNSLSVDHLHKVYDDALRVADRRAVFIGGAISKSYDSWEAAGLDVHKFTKAIAYIQEKSLRAPSTVKGELDEIYDLTTDKIYSIKDGKLVDADGKVMDEARYADDIRNNCHGSFVKDCELVFECLLSGDPRGLSRCLGKLSVESMYAVAKSEVAKMNPKVIKKVLNTFDIRENKHGKIEEYIEWRGSLESRLTQKLGNERGSKTAGAILGNKKLLEYLRNVMEIVRSNPAIVDNGKDRTLSDLPVKTENKISYFIKPTNINRAAALSTQLGSLVNQLNFLPVDLTAALRGPMNTSNVAFGQLGMPGLAMGMGMGLMRGGGCVEDSVATMEAIYKQILEEMKRNGKDLVDEDKRRIENAIEQIKKNNTQLAAALNDLKGFMRLNSALTAGLTSVSLNDIKGSSNVELSNQIKTFESSINNTASSQISLMTALVDQVFRPMSQIAAGYSNSLLRPI